MLLTILKIGVRIVLFNVVSLGVFTLVWLATHNDALQYALATRDKKWKKLPDADRVETSATEGEPEVRKVFFIRHGESTWNVTFNKSKMPWHFLPRLWSAAITEIRFMLSGSQDSWFSDPSLSDEGIEQAEDLRKFLSATNGVDSATQELTARLLGRSNAGPSILVSSNLRRSISTGLIALQDRLSATGEKMKILSYCQEISPNPDTLSATPAYQIPPPSWKDEAYKQFNLANAYATQLDASNYEGNKTAAINGLDRLLDFNKWLFEQSASDVVVAGHSLWFKSFFDEFLPRSSLHIARSKKMVNGGCVAFDLQKWTMKGTGEVVYRIDQASIRIIFGGFKK